MSYRNYSTANGHIVDPSGNSDYTTIQAAITASSSGQTVFIRPGTYTENLTLKVGVNLVSFNGDGDTPNVTIIGKCTLTAAGTVSISGIRLQTNSDFALAVTGSAASVVNLIDCYLNFSNNTGISFTSSNAAALISVYRCTGNLGTTGIALHSMSSTGGLVYQYCYFLNTGASVTAASNSAGIAYLNFSTANHIFSTSSTGNFLAEHSIINPGTLNTTAITTAGTGALNQVFNCIISTGSASSISVGSGTTLMMNNCSLDSSNTNCITGAGTIHYQSLSFTSTSKTINVTTQTTAGTLFGSTTTAPTAGMLGQQIRATRASGSELSLSNGVAADVASISLTAGIWDVTGCIQFGFSSTFVGTFGTTVGTTSATTGTFGDNYFLGTQVATATTVFGNVHVPAYRITLTSTTTVYLVAIALINAGTINAIGRISGTRVG